MNVTLDASFFLNAATIITVIIGVITLTNSLKKDRRELAETQKKELTERTVAWTNITRDVADVKKDVSEIKGVLGNGGCPGMKAEIEALRTNYEGNMAKLTNQVFGVNTPALLKLQDRVSDMEKERSER